MPTADDPQTLQKALSLHQSGDLNQAADLYRQLINTNPNNATALHFLGVIEASAGRIEQAKVLVARSISIQPTNIAFMENYATLLFQSRDYNAALRASEQGLALNDTNPPLLYASAISLFKLDRFEESLRQFDSLLLQTPTHIVAHNERGSVLAKLKRFDEALASSNKALSFNPGYAEAHLTRGNICGLLKRHDEALSAYDEALSLEPGLTDAWLGRGNVFRELRRHDEALSAYEKALAIKSDLENAWLGRGNVFSELKSYDNALAAYDKALELKADLAEAWLGRGNVFRELRRYDVALSAFDQALVIKSDLENAWLGRGNVFIELKRYDDAVAALDKALALKSDLEGAEGLRLRAKMHLSDWGAFDAGCAHLVSSVEQGNANTEPFTLLAIPSSAQVQLQCAKLWISKHYPARQKPLWKGERYRHDRIRIAYVSADFRQHATAYLAVGMFEFHDKSRFEITAISIGPDDKSEMRHRLAGIFNSFIDCRTLSDDAIASHIRDKEIDLLIDLNGFTRDARTRLFAYRPAPIQVNYLGYPGTMGASYIDYLIADQTVIPAESRGFYSEKIVSMPNTYQVNDRARMISKEAFHRSIEGLPSQKFVFCCFNNNYKITPHLFDCWMRILRQVEGSVLWLLGDSPPAATNLKKEAEARGVNSGRLVFAKRMPLPEHLARHRLADLFLDTLPYNAHTTASDALWAGLPVLTCIGETFAGRVAASLLNAIRLPELIAPTLEAYENMAIYLATHSDKLSAIKCRLAEHRLTTPLFDTGLFTKHIEATYTAMYERYQAGLAPDHIVISS
jgi:protein O-GlcNAc transferase